MFHKDRRKGNGDREGGSQPENRSGHITYGALVLEGDPFVILQRRPDSLPTPVIPGMLAADLTAVSCVLQPATIKSGY